MYQLVNASGTFHVHSHPSRTVTQSRGGTYNTSQIVDAASPSHISISPSPPRHILSIPLPTIYPFPPSDHQTPPPHLTQNDRPKNRPPLPTRRPPPHPHLNPHLHHAPLLPPPHPPPPLQTPPRQTILHPHHPLHDLPRPRRRPTLRHRQHNPDVPHPLRLRPQIHSPPST